jgi:hypothetical protein
MRACDWRIPFGKFRGQRLGDVPTEYLTWLWNENIVQEPSLAYAIGLELDYRAGRQPEDPPPEPEPPPRPRRRRARARLKLAAAVEPIIAQWHPDRGGNLVVMQAINDAADKLRELLNAG